MAEDWAAWNENNRRVIAEFREHEGKVGNDQNRMPILILTTIGAKSGLIRESPLCYIMDGEALVVAASKGGHPSHPHWYINVVAQPEVTVEVGTERFAATASFPQGPERRRLYDAIVAEMPVFAEFERLSTEREIPVVRLTRS